LRSQLGIRVTAPASSWPPVARAIASSAASSGRARRRGTVVIVTQSPTRELAAMAGSSGTRYAAPSGDSTIATKLPRRRAPWRECVRRWAPTVRVARRDRAPRQDGRCQSARAARDRRERGGRPCRIARSRLRSGEDSAVSALPGECASSGPASPSALAPSCCKPLMAPWTAKRIAPHAEHHQWNDSRQKHDREIRKTAMHQCNANSASHSEEDHAANDGRSAAPQISPSGGVGRLAHTARLACGTQTPTG